jgi:hypothetical protein
LIALDVWGTFHVLYLFFYFEWTPFQGIFEDNIVHITRRLHSEYARNIPWENPNLVIAETIGVGKKETGSNTSPLITAIMMP